MSKESDFCIPTRGTKVPAGLDCLHEIKYDGYRVRLERDGNRVRLISRNGYDWTSRYPWIVEAALKTRRSSSLTVKRSFSAATPSPISTPCIRESTIARCGSMPSI